MSGSARRLVIILSAVAFGPSAVSAQDVRKPAAVAAKAKTAAAPATASPRPAPVDPNDPRMKTLLAAWEKQSAKLKTLDVQISRVDKSPAWGDEEFKGRAILESPDHAWLDFNKVAADEKGKEKLIPHERIISTGKEVWQFRPEVKQVFIFPLDKQNKQRALEEGPLPFLFNMKAAEAESRYVMALVNEKPKYYIISVTPRLMVDQEAFSKAFLQLDRATYLPDRIVLFSPDGSSTKDFRLTKVGANVPVSPDNFEWQDPGKGWQIVRDPGGNGPAPKGKAVGKRQPPPAAPGAANPPRRAAVAPRRPPN